MTPSVVWIAAALDAVYPALVTPAMSVTPEGTLVVVVVVVE